MDADAIIVVSAEYNHSIPPALSNLMDHFPGSSFALKPSGIMCYSPGKMYFLLKQSAFFVNNVETCNPAAMYQGVWYGHQYGLIHELFSCSGVILACVHNTDIVSCYRSTIVQSPT